MLKTHGRTILKKVSFTEILSKSLLGCSLEDFTSQTIFRKNKLVISKVSKFVSLTNKDFFYERLVDKLPEEVLNYIRLSTEEIEDELGRITYFYVRIGPFKVPLPQPGTFSFVSGVKSDSNLVVNHGPGGQQNGAILGNGCATFLAKLLGRLSANYQRNCAMKSLDAFEFFPDIYKDTLMDILYKHSVEDATE